MKGRFVCVSFSFFFEKLDTFIIHVKEITVKFNLGRSRGACVNQLTAARRIFNMALH